MMDILDTAERDAVFGGNIWCPIVYVIDSLPFPIGPISVPSYFSEGCYS